MRAGEEVEQPPGRERRVGRAVAGDSRPRRVPEIEREARAGVGKV